MLLSALLLLHASFVSASDKEGSAAWNFLENNNRLIQFQKNGGDHKAGGKVKLEYFAHSAFRITSPRGLSLLIDPWRNDPSGGWGIWFPDEFPEVYSDVVLSTHAHFDHDAVHRVHAPVTLERPVGIYSLGDVKITGLGDKHMYKAKGSYRWTEAFTEFGVKLPPNNPLNLDNSIILIETGGLRLVHWGDNRPDPSEFVFGALKGVDVLFLPIDGSEHILTAEDANGIIKKLSPKVVIPIHYKTKGAVSVLSTLQSAESWVATTKDPIYLKSYSYEFDAASIGDYKNKTVYFGDNYAKE
jgi:L-ascorbate metabolism protein UlaG (beta-lactamase superfamily)